MRKVQTFAGLVVLTACFVWAMPARADVVSDWNAQILLDLKHRQCDARASNSGLGAPGLRDCSSYCSLLTSLSMTRCKRSSASFNRDLLFGPEEVQSGIVRGSCCGGRPQDARPALSGAAVAPRYLLQRLPDGKSDRPSRSRNSCG